MVQEYYFLGEYIDYSNELIYMLQINLLKFLFSFPISVEMLFRVNFLSLLIHCENHSSVSSQDHIPLRGTNIYQSQSTFDRIVCIADEYIL